MKIFFNLLIFFLLCNSTLIGKTYALIIGISEYQDKGIKDLQFADDDALAFRNFLLSSAGGALDSNNIIMLLNDQAKVGDIYAAKRMLELKVKKNDLVYFYFSGHGGVESDIYESGFLLAHDSPINNFQNNAVEILHINKMANTFSAQTKANVILITDACRSGSLGGIDDVGKKLLLQDQLIEANKREIRMASCLHDQLSLEDKVWGGGRGLFSYQLLNGLKGSADENHDLKVTLNELQRYLNNSMTEEVDKYLFDPQTPLFDGEEKTILSYVDTAFTALEVETRASLDKTEVGTKSVTAQIISTNDHFFNQLEETFFNGTKSYFLYKDEPINDFIDTLFAKKLYLNENELDQNELTEKFVIIQSKINADPEAHFAFKQKLAATIHNVIQKVINAYISVDKDELERRQFYNSNGKVFQNFADMIDIALNAVSINSELYQILEMKKWYFLGLANRIDVISKGNADSLINEAIIFQEKAEKVNNNAAYIQNELGILYEYKKDTTKAKQKYLRAIALVPEWALPYSNLSNLYYTLGKYELGKEMAEKALELHPDLNLANFSLGRNSSKKGNYLLAKESYLKAIRSNPKHYIPYQYLGQLYMHIAEFELADKYLREAELLKNAPLEIGISSLGVAADQEVITRGATSMYNMNYSPIEVTIEEKEVDILKLFYHGKVNHQKESFEKIIQLDKQNFITYKALGDFYYELDHYMEAEHMYKNALTFYMDRDSFFAKSIHLSDTTYENSVFLLDYYQKQYFNSLSLQEKLGNLYRKRGLYDKAIQAYKNIITIDPLNKSIYYRLWDLYEYLNNYQEAEEVIEDFSDIDPKQGINELYAFYTRAIDNSEDPNYYNLAAGLLMYDEFIKDYPNPYFFKSNEKDPTDPTFLSDNIVSIGSEIIIAEGLGEPQKLATLHFEKMANNHIYFDNYQIAAKLGRLYGARGAYQLTKEYFELASKNPNSSSYANIYLSNLNSQYYNYTEAYQNLKALQKSSQLDYQTSLDLIEYAILAGDFQRADSLIKAVKNINLHQNKNILKQEALSYYLRGNDQKSIDIYKILLDEDPNNPLLAFTLFRIYAQNQNTLDADPYLGKALNNGIMQYATLMRYDNYAFKGMYRFTKLASGILGASLTTKQ